MGDHAASAGGGGTNRLPDAVFDEAYARAQAANPSFEISAEAFRAFIEERLATDRPPAAAVVELRVEALYLTCACAAGHQAAIVAFERAYGANIDVAVKRAGGSVTVTDEVRQIIRERFFARTKERRPRIADYGGRGDLGRWVRAAATRIAIDLHRTTGREVSSDDILVERALPADDPEIALIKGRYAGELNVAVRDAFGELSPEARNDLRLYYVDGLTLDEIARLERISPATVSRRLSRARDLVLDRTRALLCERLRLDLREVASILGVMGSRLDIGASALAKKTIEGR